MKALLLKVSALCGLILVAAPALPAHASFYPSCTVYASTATVPVSGECEPYYVNGIKVYDAFYINQP